METNTSNQSYTQQFQLPNASGVLVMGILSIVCFCCLAAGFASLVLGILAIIYGNKAISEFQRNPDTYTKKSLENAKTGRICGIIGVSLGALWFIIIISYLSFIGWTLGALITSLPY